MHVVMYIPWEMDFVAKRNQFHGFSLVFLVRVQVFPGIDFEVCQSRQSELNKLH